MKVKFLMLSLGILAGCQTAEKTIETDPYEQFTPHVNGNTETISSADIDELRHLQLISTNLVSALVQVPKMKAGATTLQVSNPESAFGNTLVRALEEVGFGIQRVTADQGLNYVTYGKRLSDTESGVVTDYGLSVGGIELRREYNLKEGRVFPASVIVVRGTDGIVDIELDDSLFLEQGGSGDTFISGVGGADTSAPTTKVTSVTVNEYDETPMAKRTKHSEHLQRARQRVYERESADSPINLNQYEKLRRTVLIFEDKKSNVMGRGNKIAVGQLVETFVSGDVISIAACDDADGQNKQSQIRAIRVEEEFISHGLDAKAVQIEPCARASFRHASDNSPIAVAVVQYRKI